MSVGRRKKRSCFACIRARGRHGAPEPMFSRRPSTDPAVERIARMHSVWGCPLKHGAHRRVHVETGAPGKTAPRLPLRDRHVQTRRAQRWHGVVQRGRSRSRRPLRACDAARPRQGTCRGVASLAALPPGNSLPPCCTKSLPTCFCVGERMMTPLNRSAPARRSGLASLKMSRARKSRSALFHRVLRRSSRITLIVDRR